MQTDQRKEEFQARTFWALPLSNHKGFSAQYVSRGLGVVVEATCFSSESAAVADLRMRA